MTKVIDNVILIDTSEQQCLSLMLETNIKTIMFCIPKITFRMMQTSQKMTTYSLVRHKKTKIIAFQPFQPLIIIHNVLSPHPQVDYILTHLQYYVRLVKNIYVL